MVSLHLQWLDWLRHRPAGECYAMPCIWGRALPDRTFPPLDLRKDDLCRSDKVGESRCFCAPARHSRKTCHQGSSWRFIGKLGTYICFPRPVSRQGYIGPLAQEYFKEDVGVASRVHISYFRDNLVQHRSSFHCDVAYLANRLARLE